MKEGFNNFLRVFVSSLVRPSRIIVLGVGILLSFLFTSMTLLIIPLSLVAMFLMSWVDTNNPEFIKQVLTRQELERRNQVIINIRNLANKVNSQINSRLVDEVQKDLIRARNTLRKIDNVLKIMPVDKKMNVTFIKDYMSQLVDRLVYLTRQEQYMRKLLEKEDEESIRRDLDDLKQKLNNTSDEVVQAELKRAIDLKDEQLSLLLRTRKRLQRTDSYIIRIGTVLENSHANLAKMSIQDDPQIAFDEGVVLTESLRQVVKDIDRLDSKSVEIKNGEKYENNIN
jgi:hypothetical protein